MAALATLPSLSQDGVTAFDSMAFAAELARLGVSTSAGSLAAERVVDVGWPELARALPDGGLPRGVVELAIPIAKPGTMPGGATTIALSAVSAAHARDARAWCAWITPSGTPSLYAPAVAQRGVDLDRLLVVRPEPAALARTVVKVVGSGAFEIVVVDALSGLGGEGRGKKKVDGSVVVRKLALFAEEQGTASILVTNAYAPRPLPWPVALRLEVERRLDAIAVRVTKDRRGRASAQQARVVRLAPNAGA